MPGLFRRCLAAVFDLKRCAAVFFAVINHHIELVTGELELAYLVSAAQHLRGFQQNNILQNAASDHFLLLLIEHGKGLILQQHMNQRLSLAIPHTGLRKQDMFHRVRSRLRCLDLTIYDQV